MTTHPQPGRSREVLGGRHGTAEAIRGAGADLVYLPPYSPDRNPIEQVFGKAEAETPAGRDSTPLAPETA